MIYFVTGITGFVGSHMVDKILKYDPSAKIFGLKRWRSRNDNIVHLLSDSRVTFLEGDLLDFSSLNRAFKTARPNYVLHFAAQSFPGASYIRPIDTLQTNIIGTTNLLEVIKDSQFLCDPIPIILSVSSSEVYGNPTKDEVPIKETNAIRAANPYSISKVGQDLISQYYHSAHGLQIIITRMFSHEGARRGDMFALSSFAKQIVFFEKNPDLTPIIRVGNLNSVRTYAHIDDATEAYWLAIKNDKIQFGVPYNIGGNRTKTVGEMLDLLLSLSNLNQDKVVKLQDEKLMRPTDITLQIPDSTKFKEITSWEPKKEIEEICIDLLEYWRVNEKAI